MSLFTAPAISNDDTEAPVTKPDSPSIKPFAYLKTDVLTTLDGFDTVVGFGPFRKNFNNGNFENVFELTLEDARIALKLKYYQLVTRGTIPECNKIVADVFTDNTVYVLDGLDMTMTYVFDKSISSALKSAIDDFDLLPRPSTVKVETIYLSYNNWGFGSFRKNFNNGNFGG
ncbi:unnamed protein product [marine sediment metagenome]|uniref:Uncharacterized protein n=1 Tax=marine sediment metagenome TaxID=412755 RepID=X1KLC9_9ZZZZ